MEALEYAPINHKENNNYSINVTELLEVAKKVLEGKEEIFYNDLDKESLSDIENWNFRWWSASKSINCY